MAKGNGLVQKSAAVRRGEELCDAVKTNKVIAAKAFYEIGAALVELEKKELWRPLGHASFTDMLETRDLVGRSQAFKFMRVARHFAPHTARELGVEKSDAIVQYAEATAANDAPALLLETGITIDGKVRPIEGLSAREILREANKTRQNRKNAKRDPARKSALLLSRAAAKALSDVLGERVAVKPRHVPSGWVVTLTLSMAGVEELQRRVVGRARRR